MTSTGTPGDIGGAHIIGGEAYRFIPEPETSNTFQSLLGGVARVATAVTSGAASVLGGPTAEIGGQYQDLINVQLESQKQMMLVSMISNVEKSKHETQMAAVRNIRVG